MSPAASVRRLDIQGLRAVAVLLVVLFHAGLPIPGGFIGVDVFFVISGFVITGLLHRQYIATGRIDFARFYRRRLQRLTPALAVMVGVTLVLSALLQSPMGAQRTTGLTGAGAMLFSANFAIPLLSGGYFDAPSSANPLLNTWSLSVEEQFYFVFPALLLLAWSIGRRLRKQAWMPVVVVLALTVLSFDLMLITSRMSGYRGELLFGFYGPVGRAWEFGVGAALALVLARRITVPRRLSGTASAIGIAMIIGAAFVISSTSHFPDAITLLPVVGTALLLFGGTSQRGLMTRLLSTGALVRVGDISYSWYLWHWPIIVFALILWPMNWFASLAAATLSLLPAWISYRWIEQPIRALNFTTRVGVTRLIALSFLPVLILCGALLIGARAQWGISWETAGDASQSAAADRGCHDTHFDPSKCTWPVDDSRGTVMLVGDSQAHALSDGLLKADSELGYSTVITSQNACPFTAPGRISWNPRYAAEKAYCQQWQQDVLDYALKTRPKVVVVANRSPLYVNSAFDYATLQSRSGDLATSDTESASYWGEMLTSTVTQLNKAGIGVVIVADAPEGASADIQSRQSLLVRHPSIPIRATRSDADSLRAQALVAEQGVVQEARNAILVDPFMTLCSDTICPGDKDGKPLFTDGTHLSRVGSLALADQLRQAVAEASHH